MAITNSRLLEGVSQALQTLDAKASDALSKGLLHAVAIAVDELRNRDNTDTLRERYRKGYQLTAALLTNTKPSDKLQHAFAALPKEIDAEASWDSGSRIMAALLDFAEQLSLMQLKSTSKTADALAEIKNLLDWETEGYAFARLSAAPAIAMPAIPQITAESVETFIRSHGGDYAEARVTTFRPLTGGFSKQTILLDVETDRHGKEGFALRADGSVKVLGLRGQDISREFHALRYANAGGILCAQPVWLHYGKTPPYFISRQIPGRNVGDGINGNEAISDNVTRSLAEVMASIHQLRIDQSHPDVAASHYAMSKPLTREQAQRAFIEEWVAVWRKTGRKSPITASAIQWALDSVPQDTRPAALVHCDCGFNNLLVHDEKISAILDWEISHLGDPAEDISWLMYQLKDEDTRTRFMTHYRNAGGEAFDAFRLKYYDVIASLKMLIAMPDIGEKFQSTPNASVHLCAYALPYIQGPASAIVKQIQEAEQLQRG